MSNPLFEPLAGIMEITMNRVLPLDPDYQEKLNGLSDQVIAIFFSDWQMQLFFLPKHDQFIVLTSFEGNTDVKLTGNSWDFFQLGINQKLSDSSTVIDNNIHFEGNVAVGQKFAQLFSELNIDWEESIADVTGDIFAHRASHFARQAGDWLKDVFNTSQDNFSEYLQEELRITPAKIELENFYDDLTDLCERSDKLLEKFQLLKMQEENK